MDQIHSVYMTHGNVYKFDEDGTNNWVPLSRRFIPISIVYDRSTKSYRIMCVEPGSTTPLINSPILSNSEFILASLKFGHWTHIETGVVYGIGFHTERDQENFVHYFKKVHKDFTNRVVKSSKLPQSSKRNQSKPSSRGRNNDRDPEDLANSIYDESSAKLREFKRSSTSRQAESHSKDLQSTYVPSDKNNNFLPKVGVTAQQVYNASMENKITKAPPLLNGTSGPDHDETIKLLQSVESYLATGKISIPSNNENMNTIIGETAAGKNESSKPGKTLEGGQESSRGQKRPGESCPTKSSTKANNTNNTATANKKHVAGSDSRPTFSTMLQQVRYFKEENDRLKKALVISAANVDKWENELNTLRSNNSQLMKALSEMRTKLEDMRQNNVEYKEEVERWRDTCQMAQKNHSEKFNEVLELQTKLRNSASEQARLNDVVNELKEEIRSLQEEASTYIMKEEEKREMEERYQKLVADLRKENDAYASQEIEHANVMRGVDHLLAGTIQGLINIHSQIKQSFQLS